MNLNFRNLDLLTRIGLVVVILLILGGLTLPYYVEARQRANARATVRQYEALRVATARYIAKHGCLPASATNWDAVLVNEGFLRQPFSSDLGAATVEIVPSIEAAISPAMVNSAFNLDFKSTPNDTFGSVAQVILEGVPLPYARVLSLAIDKKGYIYEERTLGTDLLGKVKYEIPITPKARGSVAIYVANK